MQTVDIDLIGNTMREPERERLSLILNELGTGLAGPRRDLNEVDPARQPRAAGDRQGARDPRRQNTQLEQLAVNSDTVLAPLARDRAHVAGAIRNTSEVPRRRPRSAARSRPTSRRSRRSSTSCEPTMVRLGALADATTPVLTDLGARAPRHQQHGRRLGPFSQAAIPAVDSLGEAAKTGTPGGHDARARDRRPARAGQGRAAGGQDAARGARVASATPAASSA